MKKTTTIILLSLLLVGVVSAATVYYASNSGTATLKVDTPMSVIFQETGTDTYDLGNVLGGEKVTFTTVATNNANEAVDVYKTAFQVTAPGNFDGTEFDSINMIDRGTDVGNILPGLCFVRADGTSANFATIASENTRVAKLMACSNGVDVDGKYSHPSGSAIDNVITVDLSVGIQSGNYTFKVCHLTSLIGSVC